MKNNSIGGFFTVILGGTFAISTIGKLISFGSEHPVGVWVLIFGIGIVISVLSAIAKEYEDKNRGGKP